MTGFDIINYAIDQSAIDPNRNKGDERMPTPPITLEITLYENEDKPTHYLHIHKLPDERWILKAILEIQRDAASYLLDCASRDLDGDYSVLQERALTQFDYNGDHVDYNPACARILTTVTDALTGDGYTRDELDETIITALGFTDDDFETLNFETQTGEPRTTQYALRSPKMLLCALLSDRDFLENLDTWGGPANELFDIDYIED